MIVVRPPVTPAPGKRIGQGGVVECDHPKRRGSLGLFRGPPEGDVCDTCGWKEAVPMTIYDEDGTRREVNAAEFMQTILGRKSK